jgi:hydrophobic/amphiphilic exporter-1 (mainly G- bacteria), HAE1 family
VTGGLDREIQVEVDPLRLDAYGLQLSQVAQALAGANFSAPGGTILQGRYRYPLRTLGEFQTVSEIGDVVVARQRRREARPRRRPGCRFPADPAARRGTGDRRVRGARVDRALQRHEAVGVLVFKESGANTVRVAQTVEEVLEAAREEFPAIGARRGLQPGRLHLRVHHNVVQALVFGGLLAFLVLFLFLRDSRYPFAIAPRSRSRWWAPSPSWRRPAFRSTS